MVSQTDEMATVAQITLHYKRVVQRRISDDATPQTIKQTSYSSRRPCWVSLLSDKNKKLRLQFASDHKKLDNSRLAKFCLIWSGLNFDFLCDIRAKVWCGQQECRDLYCLVSIVQSASSSSGDVIVSGIYSGSIE